MGLTVTIHLEGSENGGISDGHDPQRKQHDCRMTYTLSQDDLNGPSMGQLEEKFDSIIKQIREIL